MSAFHVEPLAQSRKLNVPPRDRGDAALDFAVDAIRDLVAAANRFPPNTEMTANAIAKGRKAIADIETLRNRSRG